jgi:hypothetical protein
MSTSVRIEPRFNGPPDSGNGGYTCGLLAAALEGPAEVSLRRPPPLDRELTVERDGERALLVDGDQLVAEAAPVAADWDVPAPVTVAEAEAAEPGSPFLSSTRPFTTCFVCGTERDENDPGLRIFTGPLSPGEDAHAGTWTPDPSLADARGAVRPEVVWASLDCPTSGPVGNQPDPDGTVRPIVLARLAADLRAPVEAGHEHVVMAWRIAADGRKRHSGSALFTADGELLASARALWIELRDQSPS